MNATADHALSDPARVQARLEQLDVRLAELQNDLESAALEWFREKRFREREHAEEFVRTEGTVGERNAAADRAIGARVEEQLLEKGYEPEGRYEALKAVCRVLDTRAAIGMSLLRSQSRFGG